MEKTHNPHYKGFGMSFYDTCDWQIIMYSLIPSTSLQPDFGGLTFAVIMEFPDQNIRCPHYITWSTSLTISPCIVQYEGKIFVSLWIHLNGIIVGKSFVWSCLAAAFHGLRWGFCYGGGVNKTEISVVEIIHSKQPHTDELPCSRGHVVCVHHVCRASVCTCIRCLLVS